MNEHVIVFYTYLLTTIPFPIVKDYHQEVWDVLVTTQAREYQEQIQYLADQRWARSSD